MYELFALQTSKKKKKTKTIIRSDEFIDNDYVIVIEFANEFMNIMNKINF